MRILTNHFFGLVSVLTFVLMSVNCCECWADDNDAFVEGIQGRSNIIRVPSAVIKIADSVTVPAEYAGVISRVMVVEGQLVKKGDLIANITDSELRLRMERAQLENQIANLSAENDVDIRYSEKSCDVAKAEVSRSHRANLKVANSVPVARLEKQQLEHDRSTLQLEQARRDFRIAKLKTGLTENELRLSEFLLKKTEIRSPMAGMVVAVERHLGEWVQPSETIARIVRVDRLRVEGFVSAENAGKIELGMPVEVKFSQAWLQGLEHKGKVVFVSPEANPVNSQVLVWAEIRNDHKKLVAGLRGEIHIVTDNTLVK